MAGFIINDVESRGSPTKHLVGQSIKQMVACILFEKCHY